MRRLVLITLLLSAPCTARPDVLIRGARVYDGTGSPGRIADVRVAGDRIVEVGAGLAPRPGVAVLDASGLALAPGFIDMHSHADDGLPDDPDAATATRQGVTTVVVGQDGESPYPLADWYARLETHPAAVNVASLAGQATLREQVMGDDLYRVATPAEIARMSALLERELAAGAFGLSTGLEYEESHFSSTGEVIALARVAAAHGGHYVSHVRDEGNGVFDSWDEVLRIGREAGIPVEISHIKLGTTSVWHQAAARMPGYFERARREGVKLAADVYPYDYWHATIRVMVPDRDWFNAEKVSKAIAENGGPDAIRLGRYGPDPSLAGHTLAEVAAGWQVTPTEAYMRIVRETGTGDENGARQESVLVTSMADDDLRWFIADPRIMFCSDGSLHGSHPRGAGAFARVLGRYVREEHVLTLEAAIHKMTALPAAWLGVVDRGRIAPGQVADLVLFDPATVIDRSTVADPEAPPLGIPDVMVSGTWVVRDGAVTGARTGKVLRHRVEAR